MNTGHNSISIKSLAGIDFDEIATAFSEAFADYGLNLDKTGLYDMLTRRGARFDLSFAAFCNDRIVSFIINGTGTFNSRPTAYDSGTGTLKEFRGLGLTDRIFNYASDRLQEAGIETYLLEVLQHNTPAVKIYTRQGFEVSREFDCYTATNATILDRLRNVPDTGVTIGQVTADTLLQHLGILDFTPSWQNSPESIMRHTSAFLCVMAYKNGVPVGLGVSETAYGDITLLAVDRRHRRNGIGSLLLRELVTQNRCPQAKVLNIDHACTGMGTFLNTSGFELYCRQYEMTRRLS